MTNVTKVISTQHFVGITLHGIALKHLPEGAEFRRKTMSISSFTKNHYNPKDDFGAECYSCTNNDDINREIFLNPNTVVYIEDDGQEVVVAGSDEQLNNEDNIELAEAIEIEAVKINYDVNGNPRYYISASEFRNQEGNFVRPAFADKYRGKKYGAGWVFQSYSLNSTLKRVIAYTDVILAGAKS
jgi:hypothetical protein